MRAQSIRCSASATRDRSFRGFGGVGALSTRLLRGAFVGALPLFVQFPQAGEQEVAVGLEVADLDLVAPLHVLGQVIDAELKLGAADILLAALLRALAQLPAQDAEGRFDLLGLADHGAALLAQARDLAARPRPAARAPLRSPPGCAAVSVSRLPIFAR